MLPIVHSRRTGQYIGIGITSRHDRNFAFRTEPVNCRYLILLLALVLPIWSMGENNADEIIQRSVEALQRDFKASPEFDCLERDRVSGGTRTYEDTMILGSPYQRLIAVNGRPLTPAASAKEQQKLNNVLSERETESPQKRDERIAKYKKEQERDHSMMNEMVKAFQFRLAGETKLVGRDVYVLQATPRPGYRPPNMETEALTGMKGMLWIDKQTFQRVKVEAQVMHHVSIEGFLAQVEPGTHFELEKAPVAPGVWLPTHFPMRSLPKFSFCFRRTVKRMTLISATIDTTTD